MTEHERLAELLSVCRGIDGIGTDLIEKQVDHLLDHGVIVPPCKLKSRVWAAYTGIEEYYVSSIMQKSDGTLKIRLTKAGRGFVHEITENDIGDCYFLAREEAEAALAERRKA